MQVLALIVPSIAYARSPAYEAADAAWRVAAAEPDPARALPLWRAAATAFDHAVSTAGAQAVEAAYSAVLAWSNISIVKSRPPAPIRPTPPPADDQGLIAAVEVYVRLAPSSDEAPDVLFRRARVFHHYRQYLEAEADLARIVTRYARAEVAEFAAVLLLDMLNRAGKHDALVAWVDRMRANPKLLRGRPELQSQLVELHVTAIRKRAEAEERAGALDPAAYLRCARLYGEAAGAHRRYSRRDELLFNAGICYERGGARTEARRSFEASARLRTPLAADARRRAARLR